MRVSPVTSTLQVRAKFLPERQNNLPIGGLLLRSGKGGMRFQVLEAFAPNFRMPEGECGYETPEDLGSGGRKQVVQRIIGLFFMDHLDTPLVLIKIEGNQEIGGIEEAFAPGQIRQGGPPFVEFEAIGCKALGRAGIGQIERLSGGAAGEKHSRFLEGFSDGRQEEAEGRRFGEVRLLEEAPGIHGAKPSKIGGKTGICIVLIQTTTGKDIGPSHKVLAPVAPHEKHLKRSLCPAAQQDDGRRVPRRLVHRFSTLVPRKKRLRLQGFVLQTYLAV
ncbi:MAG: hypothetical protein A3J94_12050 [Syntrophus sp. RIFOXYC2_FULL_54_9]|nr:MAG: hypothetical protein A3J94_12050 [Syntrophus sp. RIFOXYC2_FULL_54_9]HBB18323.1 hypothetical protein [Syntrophus sp. (in: bacteria)]